MKIRTFAIAAGVVALGLAAWNTPSNAQGPLWDRVNVNLPYSVTIGERTLQPGEYVIQQLPSAAKSPVLLIYSDRGMKFETSAMTIPALDQRTPEDTKVILHHFGPDYYFDKIWIQGKNYGYEFPLPDSVKSRERERLQPLSVAATYSTVPAEEATAASNTATTTAANGQSTTSAATNQATTSAATNRATTSAATNGSTMTAQSAANSNPTTTAQAATTQRSTTPQAAGSAVTTQSTTQQADMSASTAQSTAMAQNTTQSAATTPSTMSPSTTRSTMSNRDMSGSADRSMPNTSAGWLMMLLSGGALSGAGMALRRKR
jgi:hypothetical protein